MKRKAKFISWFIVMLLSVTLISVSASAASYEELMTQYLLSHKAGDFESAQYYADILGEAPRDSSLAKMSAKFKNTYRNFVKKYSSGYYNKPYNKILGYYLADLNGDRKPELLIDSFDGSEAGHFLFVYRFKNGKVKKVGKTDMSSSVAFAYPGKGVVVIFARMGLCHVRRMYIENNRLKEEDYGKSGEWWDSEGKYMGYHMPKSSLYNHVLERKYVGSKYVVKLDYKELR